MRAAQYRDYGGPEVIEIVEIEKPELKEGQILVTVYAAALNAFDRKLRAGYLKEMVSLPFPITIGADFSGVVSEVAEGVMEFTLGDEVYGSAIVLNGGSGALAEYAAVNTGSIAKKPPGLSHQHSAAIVLAGVSTFQALDQLDLVSGSKLLVHGGAGGIGSTAIQYAKHLGAYVATTVREEDKEFVNGLGADEAIDYEKQSFDDILADYDAVFDTVGSEVYLKSFRVLKQGGAIISMVERPKDGMDVKHDVRALFVSTQVNTESLNRLRELVDGGVINPQIDAEYTLEQAQDAFRHFETDHPRGKVVVKLKS